MGRKKETKADRWRRAAETLAEKVDNLQTLRSEIDAEAKNKLNELAFSTTAVLQELAETLQKRMDPAVQEVERAREELEAIQQEYNDWYDAMPEGWQQGEKGFLIDELANIDLDTEIDPSIIFTVEMNMKITGLEELEGLAVAAEEAEEAELP